MLFARDWLGVCKMQACDVLSLSHFSLSSEGPRILARVSDVAEREREDVGAVHRVRQVGSLDSWLFTQFRLWLHIRHHKLRRYIMTMS